MCFSRITRTLKNGDGELEFLVVIPKGQRWSPQEEEGTQFSIEDRAIWLGKLRTEEESKHYIYDDTGIND